MQFEDLEAWRLARLLANGVYEISRDVSFGKDYGLRDQIRRASVSAMSNIAEGFERTGNAEKLHFYNIARASAGEVRSLLYVVEDNYPHLSDTASELRVSTVGVGKVISGLIASTKRRSAAKFLGIIAILSIPIFHLLTLILAT